MDIVGRINEYREEMRKLMALVDQNPEVSKIPVEVTCVIPIYNAFRTLPRVLFHLEPGAQSVPMKIMLCDNSSEDPLGIILSDGAERFQKWLVGREHGFADAEILPSVPRRTTNQDGVKMSALETMNTNIEFLSRKLMVAVDTPYVLYVDADVLMPVGSVRLLLEAIKADPKLAMLGCQYEAETDHVKMGSTMCRTDVMKTVSWNSMGCICRYVSKYLKSQGYRVEHLPGVYSTHLKREIG